MNSDRSEVLSQETDRSEITIGSDYSGLRTERSDAFSTTQSEKASVEKLSVTHQALLAALEDSPLLRPLHVEIRNDSYWYAMRKKLKPKRQLACITKYNTTYSRWESFIYKIKLREEDAELAAKKIMVGHFKTKWEAYKGCEKACRERDENPAKIKRMAAIMSPDSILSTHFRVLVVSEKFYGKNCIERICLVYDELVKSIGVTPIPAGQPSGLGRAPPTRMKIGSMFGAAMCDLELFHYLLPSQPLSLLIDAKTPSQWRPDMYDPPVSERFGSSHLKMRAVQIMDAAKPKSQAKRIKKLAASRSQSATPMFPPIAGASTAPVEDFASRHGIVASATSTSSIISVGSTDSQLSLGSLNDKAGFADSIGLDTSVSGVKYKKLGGIYGHFFNDLSPSVRELVLNRYKGNKNLIQVEGTSDFNQQDAEAVAKERKKVQNLRRLQMFDTDGRGGSKKASRFSAEYDKGTANESEMLEEVNISNSKMEKIVVRLQKIRRITMYHRALKYLWWRRYAAITIQRTLRGKFGRRYARLYKKLRPLAAVRIQRTFRFSRAVTILKMWRWLSFRLTRVVLPKIKRFIRNCFLSWIEKRTKNAIVIQSIARVRIAMTRYYKKRGEQYFMEVFRESIVKIQKIVRGFLIRRGMGAHIERFLVGRIDIPAALRLQRFYRGYLGRIIAERRRYVLACQLKLQLFIKAFVHRRWDEQLAHEKLIKFSATQIQRIFRGNLDREIVRLRRKARWYKRVYLPAIIRVQAIARKYRARSNYVHLLNQHAAARKLQQSYRGYKERIKAQEIIREIKLAKKNIAAHSIQKILRGYFASNKYRRMLIEHKGKLIKSGKIILRAWLNYKIAKKFQYLLEEHKFKIYSGKSEKYKRVRESMIQDIKEIKEDIVLIEKTISRAKDRTRDLDKYLAQAALRLTRIKDEMSLLTPEDFDKG